MYFRRNFQSVRTFGGIVFGGTIFGGTEVTPFHRAVVNFWF